LKRPSYNQLPPPLGFENVPERAARLTYHRKLLAIYHVRHVAALTEELHHRRNGSLMKWEFLDGETRDGFDVRWVWIAVQGQKL
jgi:hypothetical protein